MSTPKLLNWFEIPTNNLEKAAAFYREIFGLDLEMVEVDNKRFAVFPTQISQTGGAVVQAEGYVPSENGIQIFFEATGTMDEILSRIEPAGGKIVVEKYRVNEEIGDVASFKDLDGNKIGLHSQL